LIGDGVFFRKIEDHVEGGVFSRGKGKKLLGIKASRKFRRKMEQKA
jgi:hypothetical protein